jgi:ADP-heptose:LPS heptosyltransferase
MLRLNLPSFERLVLIRPGALGDTLLLLPTLALARRQWPYTEITLVARDDVARLATTARLVDQLSSYGSPQWLSLFVEGSLAPDSAQELCRLLKDSAVVAWLDDPDGLVERNLHLLGAKLAVLARGRPDPAVAEHMALTLTRGLEPLGLLAPSNLEEVSLSMPRLLSTEGDLTRIEGLWRTFDLGYHRVIAFHVGSGGAAKRWPPPLFAELAARSASSGLAPVLIAGPLDEDSIQAVIAASTTISNLPVIRDLSLGELGAFLGRVAAYVGNDSGVTHLAALTGVPTLALFGPTDPAHWAPLGQRVRVLCSSTGGMADISGCVAWEALRTLLPTHLSH